MPGRAGGLGGGSGGVDVVAGVGVEAGRLGGGGLVGAGGAGGLGGGSGGGDVVAGVGVEAGRLGRWRAGRCRPRRRSGRWIRSKWPT